ncbi:MAG TPA: SIS domain-containing protein, partial [Aggregatilineaceae bacterium]|nr:SIS domain-containing protein [Aggregatilineaceae bacterium]
QPAVWEQTLAAFRAQAPGLVRLWQPRRPARVMFTGCSSTYYLAITAANLFQSLTGVPALARPASELVLFSELVFAPHAYALLVAISRSAATTETVDALKLFRSRSGGPLLVITCAEHSPLAAQVDASLIASAAREESVAQTRSFSSMAVLAEALAATLAGQTAETKLAGLPARCERLLTDYRDLGRVLGNASEIDQFFFLGSGFLHGIACEAMLKMKERSLSYSEAYHFLEFWHGPMSMVTEQTQIVGLLSEGAQTHEQAVLRQMHQRGARILALFENGSGLELSDRVHDVVLQSGLPGWARAVLYLPVLHLLAYYGAIANHQNPDHPAHLDAVVSIDSLLSP